jgi:hypothetical protein
MRTPHGGLRCEKSSVEQQGRQALNISVILEDFPQLEAARQKADVLLARLHRCASKLPRLKPCERSAKSSGQVYSYHPNTL